MCVISRKLVMVWMSHFGPQVPFCEAFSPWLQGILTQHS